MGVLRDDDDSFAGTISLQSLRDEVVGRDGWKHISESFSNVHSEERGDAFEDNGFGELVQVEVSDQKDIVQVHNQGVNNCLDMLGKVGVVCGGYVANATYTNQHADAASVKATFESGVVKTFTVPGNGEVIVQNEIQHDTWTSHDPIKEMEVTAGGKTYVFNDPSQGGVQLRRYTIGADHSVTRDF